MLRENRVTQPLRASAPRLKRRIHIRWQLACAALGVLLVAGLAAGAALSLNPALLPEAVDMARAIFGPSVVGQIESWAFQAQDGLRQARYQATGAATHTQWAAPPAASPKIRSSTATSTQNTPAPAPTTRPNTPA